MYTLNVQRGQRETALRKHLFISVPDKKKKKKKAFLLTMDGGLRHPAGRTRGPESQAAPRLRLGGWSRRSWRVDGHVAFPLPGAVLHSLQHFAAGSSPRAHPARGSGPQGSTTRLVKRVKGKVAQSVPADSSRPHGLQSSQAPLSMGFSRLEYCSG